MLEFYFRKKSYGHVWSASKICSSIHKKKSLEIGPIAIQNNEDAETKAYMHEKSRTNYIFPLLEPYTKLFSREGGHPKSKLSELWSRVFCVVISFDAMVNTRLLYVEKGCPSLL